MKKILKNLFFVLFLSFFFGKFSLADDLKVSGNKKISINTLKEIINFDSKKNYNNSEILNDVQQKLYSSGFFKKISTKYSNNVLIIILEENPLIDFFYINGVINAERERFFYDNLELKSNKIFSEVKLKKDIEFIKSNYIDSGYLDIKIEAEIKKKSQENIVNLVLNINRGDQYKVNRIFFVGDKYFKPSTLLDSITSSEEGWWKFISSSYFSSLKIDLDKKLLKNFYLNNGFYDAQITSVDVNPDKINKNVNIVFSINSGKKYKYKNISIVDDKKNISTNDLKTLNSLLKKKLIDFYSEKEVFRMKKYIEDFLIEKKIEFVQTIFLTQKNLESDNTLNVIFKLIPKEKKYINLINIKGNSITEEAVIRDNLFFSEGDSFMNYKLARSIDNLKATSIFKKVDYDIVNNEKNNLVDINIKVEEQPTGEISAGIGIGTNGSAISSGLKEKNLFGKGIDASILGSFGTEKISGSLKLKIPKYGVNENDVFLGFDAIETEYDNGNYKSRVLGSDLAQSYEIYEDIIFNIGLGFDNDKISTTTSASNYVQSLDGSYNTFKSFYGLTFDKRNSKFKPTRGFITSFNQRFGLPGSDIEYVRNDIKNSYYYPVNEDYIFNVKSGLSSITSINNKDIKLSDRLNLSNRYLKGFEPRGIGPKDGNQFIGGNYSAFFGMSSTVPNPLPEKWNAGTSLFLDFGNVWGIDNASTNENSKLRSSTGLTLDWFSPLGPLSFVFSKTLSSADSDKEQNFSFQLGTTF